MCQTDMNVKDRFPLLTSHDFTTFQDDGLMISCEHCKFWQHAVCFTIIKEDDAPEVHLCDQCAKVT